MAAKNLVDARKTATSKCYLVSMTSLSYCQPNIYLYMFVFTLELRKLISAYYDNTVTSKIDSAVFIMAIKNMAV